MITNTWLKNGSQWSFQKNGDAIVRDKDKERRQTVKARRNGYLMTYDCKNPFRVGWENE